MIVTVDEMRMAEAKTFAAGITAESLMEQAGLEIARAIVQFFPRPGVARIFFGKGHNGGDALVAARHLALEGWRIELLPAFPEADCAELTRQKLAALQPQKIPVHHDLHSAPDVVLDGLLGLGAKRELRDPIRSAAREINRLRREENACVFSIDLPTGLDGDSGQADNDAVIADFTLSVGFAKRGLIEDRATNFAGRLAVLPLSGLAQPGETGCELATSFNLASLLPRRRFDSHKTEYGRIGILAGSVGFTGAALLAAHGAVRAGAGLVTLYAAKEIHAIAAAAAPPEVMVKPVNSYREIQDTRRDVLAVGPGLGQERREEILHLIETVEQPMVIDADAINILSTAQDVLKNCKGPRLLTPHPGEMARLFPTQHQSRLQIATSFVEKYPVTLLLKGARTIVAERGKPISYNSTGTPGMATGGMGDVLTGMCAAFLGQGLSCYDSARAAAWLAGRAAELATFIGNRSQESLNASDLLDQLGVAFKELHRGCF
jgi:hydroxyethylthiazole kinase-like uncharacterized protein yjeF